MKETILFLTGKLAHKRLERILSSMDNSDFDWQVRPMGVSVAALMTPQIIRRRLRDTDGADQIIVPGRMQGDLSIIADHFSLPVSRGPDDLNDLPEFFDQDKRPLDLNGYDCLIFAEIVDASRMSVDAIVAQAKKLTTDGANIIDLGCLPTVPFDCMEQAIKALHAHDMKVSVDSAQRDELTRANLAGADYLLSLDENNLDILNCGPAVPVVIPVNPGDMGSLARAIKACQSRRCRFYADPILDPIHYGLSDSLARYHNIRRKFKDIDMMMGIGNLTELTDVDSAGITMILMGIMSELEIKALLCVQVSHHCQRAIAEADMARRILYASKKEDRIPNNIDNSLINIHDKKSPYQANSDIISMQAMLRDRNYRIAISKDGIHLFNKDIHEVHQNPADFFDVLQNIEDKSHLFYLASELTCAHIAWQLGKRYVQDRSLDWGVAVEAQRLAKAITLRHRSKPAKAE